MKKRYYSSLINLNNYQIKKLVIILAVSLLLCVRPNESFSLINEKTFGDIQCVPYAYGDFNADKLVDIFCVSQSGIRIEVWLAQENNPLFVNYKSFYLKNRNSTVVALIPGDFNGDSIIDILVVYELNKPVVYQMSLFLGNKSSRFENNLDPEIVLPLLIKDQPLASDFDGDGVLDLLVQDDGEKNGRKFLFFDEHGQITREEKQYTENDLCIGYANSVTDINNDFTPDLILTTQNSTNNMIFEVWNINSATKQYFLSNVYLTPDPSFKYGQSLFADYDGDGVIDHLLPACKDKECQNSVLFLYKGSQWNELSIDFGTYGLIPGSDTDDFWGKNTFSVKAGDYDLNGYLDLMIILRDNNSTVGRNKEKYAMLMKNVQANSEDTIKSPTFNRTFKMDNHIISLFGYSNVVQASFFDLYDDGYLDILLTVKDSNSKYKLIAFNNEYYDDVYFLKVMVIPGLCSNDKCPFQSIPYGLNYPGALVRMETISYEYQRVILYASQLSQSSYMALQLPYTIFGLGSTPNFVDDLKVGILVRSPITGEIVGLNKEWHQIIPNSQLVINPYPRNIPSYWKMQLFITPSKNILMTAISLGSTMICLIIIIGILQLREKKMDEKERKLESQRFHFDGL